jgi:hypothetical protein
MFCTKLESSIFPGQVDGNLVNVWQTVCFFGGYQYGGGKKKSHKHDGSFSIGRIKRSGDDVMMPHKALQYVAAHPPITFIHDNATPHTYSQRYKEVSAQHQHLRAGLGCEVDGSTIYGTN